MPDIFLRPVAATDAVFLYDFAEDAVVVIPPVNPGFNNLGGMGGFDLRRLKSHLIHAQPRTKRPSARPCRPNGERLARMLDRQRQLRCEFQLRDEDELLLLDFFD